MQRKRANCFIYKAKFLVLSFFFHFNIKMSPISWRILHVCFCYFYSVAILYNFIHFILYFYTVCTTKICFIFRWFWHFSLVLLIFTFSTSDLECLCDVTDALAGLQLLVVFSTSLSPGIVHDTKKMNARVSSQICQMDCKMSTKIRWNKKKRC